MNDHTPSLRYRYLVVVILLGCSALQATALLVQFFKIQIVEHDVWTKRANIQHYIEMREPHKRGLFFSNLDPTPFLRGSERVPFTLELPLYHLYCDPKSFPNRWKRQVIRELIMRLSLPHRDVEHVCREFQKVKNRSRRLVPWISQSQRDELASWWYQYARKRNIPTNALFFVKDFRRVHPMGHLLGQVLHTVQEKRDEKTGVAVPTGGLELSLQKYLEGQPGKRRLMRSPRNTLETGEVISAPVDGADVEMTINHCLQAAVEEEIERGVLQAQAKAGWAVLVDPHSGYILAMAHYPYFYPDRCSDYFNDPKRIEYAKCRAAIDANEPGSPTKAINMAIALRANDELRAQGKPPLFSPFEKIPTRRGIFPGRRKEITDVSPCDFLNMYMALQKSSNIYMATIVKRVCDTMGDEWYREQLVHFGFGTRTGVELAGESPGVFCRPGKLTVSGRLEWSKATPYSLAMGYNLQATSLQMARAFCVFANGGYLPELTLVKRVLRHRRDDGEAEILIDNTNIRERIKRFPKILEQHQVDEIIKGLQFVTKPGGSAAKADIYGYREVGKTGTSMKLIGGHYSDKHHFTSFVGFAPLSRPRFVLAIGIDEPRVGYIAGRGLNHRGGTSTSQVFREIGRRVLELMEVPQDDPYGYPIGDPRSDPEKAEWTKEVEALRRLYKSWNKK